MSRSLLKSSGIVGLFTLASRLLGFVRETMLAAAFGAGGGMDAFLVALMIPNFGRRMFAEGAFSQAFVPVFTETKTGKSHDEARDLVAVVTGTLGGVLAVVTVIGCLAAPLLVWLFASGFATDPVKSDLSADLLRWTFPYLMFISLTSMAGGVLNAYGKFAIPAITPVILNICMIVSAFIGGGTVQVLAYAVFAAGLLQLAFQLPSLVRLRLLPRPRWAWGDGRVRKILRLMGPVMIGSSVAQISLLLNSNLSTHIGDGSVSWLYYANRLMEFPLGIFSIAVGTAILPTLAAQHAKKTPVQFSNTIDWGLRTILLIGIPATLGLILLAGPLVATVYGYHRFTARDVMMTTYALWAYGLGFMGFSLVKILAPGFYARQDTRVPVRYAIISLCIGMALSLSLFAWSRFHPFAAAHVVLAVSTSLTACINGGLLLVRLRRDAIYRPAAGWRGFALRLTLANAAMAAVILVLAGDLSHWIAAGWQWKAAHMGLIVMVSLLVYFAVLGVCGLRPRHFRPAVR